jgi:hypothetical protein
MRTMDQRPSTLRAQAGHRLCQALEGAGLHVRACYWRRLRPTRRQWALVISLEEFGPALEPGLSQLLELREELHAQAGGLEPLDIWALPPEESEPDRYARAVGERGGGSWPLEFSGTERLPPALLYRLPGMGG